MRSLLVSAVVCSGLWAGSRAANLTALDRSGSAETDVAVTGFGASGDGLKDQAPKAAFASPPGSDPLAAASEKTTAEDRAERGSSFAEKKTESVTTSAGPTTVGQTRKTAAPLWKRDADLIPAPAGASSSKSEQQQQTQERAESKTRSRPQDVAVASTASNNAGSGSGAHPRHGRDKVVEKAVSGEAPPDSGAPPSSSSSTVEEIKTAIRDGIRKNAISRTARASVSPSLLSPKADEPSVAPIVTAASGDVTVADSDEPAHSQFPGRTGDTPATQEDDLLESTSLFSATPTQPAVGEKKDTAAHQDEEEISPSIPRGHSAVADEATSAPGSVAAENRTEGASTTTLAEAGADSFSTETSTTTTQQQSTLAHFLSRLNGGASTEAEGEGDSEEPSDASETSDGAGGRLEGTGALHGTGETATESGVEGSSVQQLQGSATSLQLYRAGSGAAASVDDGDDDGEMVGGEWWFDSATCGERESAVVEPESTFLSAEVLPLASDEDVQCDFLHLPSWYQTHFSRLRRCGDLRLDYCLFSTTGDALALFDLATGPRGGVVSSTAALRRRRFRTPGLSRGGSLLSHQTYKTRLCALEKLPLALSPLNYFRLPWIRQWYSERARHCVAPRGQPPGNHVIWDDNDSVEQLLLEQQEHFHLSARDAEVCRRNVHRFLSAGATSEDLYEMRRRVRHSRRIRLPRGFKTLPPAELYVDPFETPEHRRSPQYLLGQSSWREVGELDEKNLLKLCPADCHAFFHRAGRCAPMDIGVQDGGAALQVPGTNATEEGEAESDADEPEEAKEKPLAVFRPRVPLRGRASYKARVYGGPTPHQQIFPTCSRVEQFLACEAHRGTEWTVAWRQLGVRVAENVYAYSEKREGGIISAPFEYDWLAAIDDHRRLAVARRGKYLAERGDCGSVERGAWSETRTTTDAAGDESGKEARTATGTTENDGERASNATTEASTGSFMGSLLGAILGSGSSETTRQEEAADRLHQATESNATDAAVEVSTAGASEGAGSFTVPIRQDGAPIGSEDEAGAAAASDEDSDSDSDPSDYGEEDDCSADEEFGDSDDLFRGAVPFLLGHHHEAEQNLLGLTSMSVRPAHMSQSPAFAPEDVWLEDTLDAFEPVLDPKDLSHRFAAATTGEMKEEKKVQRFITEGIDPGKLKKMELDYASQGAKILDAAKGTTGASHVLKPDPAAYMLAPCSHTPSWFVIGLPEYISLEKVGFYSLEFFASQYRHIQILGSSSYPAERWRVLGEVELSLSETHQVFDIERRCSRQENGCWVRFLKITVGEIRALSHYNLDGSVYCALTKIQVFGSTALKELDKQLKKEDEALSSQNLPMPSVGDVLGEYHERENFFSLEPELFLRRLGIDATAYMTRAASSVMGAGMGTMGANANANANETLASAALGSTGESNGGSRGGANKNDTANGAQTAGGGGSGLGDDEKMAGSGSPAGGDASSGAGVARGGSGGDGAAGADGGGGAGEGPSTADAAGGQAPHATGPSGAGSPLDGTVPAGNPGQTSNATSSSATASSTPPSAVAASFDDDDGASYDDYEDHGSHLPNSGSALNAEQVSAQLLQFDTLGLDRMKTQLLDLGGTKDATALLRQVVTILSASTSEDGNPQLDELKTKNLLLSIGGGGSTTTSPSDALDSIAASKRLAAQQGGGEKPALMRILENIRVLEAKHLDLSKLSRNLLGSMRNQETLIALLSSVILNLHDATRDYKVRLDRMQKVIPKGREYCLSLGGGVVPGTVIGSHQALGNANGTVQAAVQSLVNGSAVQGLAASEGSSSSSAAANSVPTAATDPLLCLLEPLLAQHLKTLKPALNPKPDDKGQKEFTPGGENEPPPGFRRVGGRNGTASWMGGISFNDSETHISLDFYFAKLQKAIDDFYEQTEDVRDFFFFLFRIARALAGGAARSVAFAAKLLRMPGAEMLSADEDDDGEKRASGGGLFSVERVALLYLLAWHVWRYLLPLRGGAGGGRSSAVQSSASAGALAVGGAPNPASSVPAEQPAAHDPTTSAGETRERALSGEVHASPLLAPGSASPPAPFFVTPDVAPAAESDLQRAQGTAAVSGSAEPGFGSARPSAALLSARTSAVESAASSVRRGDGGNQLHEGSVEFELRDLSARGQKLRAAPPTAGGSGPPAEASFLFDLHGKSSSKQADYPDTSVASAQTVSGVSGSLLARELNNYVDASSSSKKALNRHVRQSGGRAGAGLTSTSGVGSSTEEVAGLCSHERIPLQQAGLVHLGMIDHHPPGSFATHQRRPSGDVSVSSRTSSQHTAKRTSAFLSMDESREEPETGVEHRNPVIATGGSSSSASSSSSSLHAQRQQQAEPEPLAPPPAAVGPQARVVAKPAPPGEPRAPSGGAPRRKRKHHQRPPGEPPPGGGRN